MALAALICAYQEGSGEGRALRATLPLAGRSLVERQARLAATVGADRIVILVETLPPALAMAIDRMRSEGVSPLIARSVDEAAEALGDQQHILMVGDGFVVAAEDLARIAAAAPPAVLTLPDLGDERFERIDGQSRWGGAALIGGDMVRSTFAGLDDWDPQSTLLRRALQADARLLAATPSERGAQPPVAATGAADLDELEDRIIGAMHSPDRGWASRFLLAPIERLMTRLLLPGAISADWLVIAAAVLTGLAILLFGTGWLAAGSILMLVATPLDGIAARLRQVRLQPPRSGAMMQSALAPLAAGALIALSAVLAPTRGWGCVVLALTTIAFLLALRGEEPDPQRRDGWLAERKGMSWMMLPFAIGGFWTVGLATLALYAAGSFFWTQHQVHRPRQD